MSKPGKWLRVSGPRGEEVTDAREDLAHLVLRSDAGSDADGCGREVEELGRLERRVISVRLRRIAYSFGWLAALLLAAGAGWKNN